MVKEIIGDEAEGGRNSGGTGNRGKSQRERIHWTWGKRLLGYRSIVNGKKMPRVDSG